MKNKFGIISIAVLFNLFFEYSMRGVTGFFQHHGIFLILIPLYIAYFTLWDGVIRRYRVGMKHLLLGAFLFGCIVLTYFSGLAFKPPTVIGVNWPVLFFIVVVWWGMLQTVLGLYVAWRVVGFDADEKPVSDFWMFASAVFIVLFHIFTFIAVRTVPKGSLFGHIVMAAVIIGGLLWLRHMLRSGTPPKRDVTDLFTPHWSLDLLGILAPAAFLFSGTFVAQSQVTMPGGFVDPAAVRFVTLWTILLVIAMTLYFVLTRKRVA